MMQQLDLFEYAAARDLPEEGSIVREWHPFFSMRVPLWQVRTVRPSQERQELLAHAVPYGAYPGMTTWLNANGVEPVGVSWRVPDHDELEAWYREQGTNEYVRSLQYRVGAGANRCDRCGSVSFPEWPWTPFSHERELVELLAPHGWKALHLCR